MRIVQAAFGYVALLLGVALLIYSYAHPENNLLASGFNKSYMFYPRILLYAWIIISIAIIIDDAIKKTKADKIADFYVLIGAMFITILMCISIPRLGFLFTAIVFLLVYPAWLKYRNWKVLIPTSIVFAFGVKLFFEHLLLIQLPTFS